MKAGRDTFDSAFVALHFLKNCSAATKAHSYMQFDVKTILTTETSLSALYETKIWEAKFSLGKPERRRRGGGG